MFYHLILYIIKADPVTGHPWRVSQSAILCSTDAFVIF